GDGDVGQADEGVGDDVQPDQLRYVEEAMFVGGERGLGQSLPVFKHGTEPAGRGGSLPVEVCGLGLHEATAAPAGGGQGEGAAAAGDGQGKGAAAALRASGEVVTAQEGAPGKGGLDSIVTRRAAAVHKAELRRPRVTVAGIVRVFRAACAPGKGYGRRARNAT